MIAKVLETNTLISQVSSDSWKSELEKASSKYHIIAAWVAIFFDPIFAITDYINLPNAWRHLLVIRLCVAALIGITLFLRRQLNLPSAFIALVTFLSISVQNAYTYGLISNDVILGHSLNFIALLIGASMFVLWKWTYSVLILSISTIVTGIFVNSNTALDKEQFFVKGGFLLIVVGIFMVILIKARYDLTIKEIKARLALKATNEELGRQKEIVELNNKKITDSIQYAKRIQNSILGHQSRIDKWFSDSFVLFQPKDILSGDFYWFYENPQNNIKIVIVADCTGHGVPAAMTTVLGNSILNEIVVQRKIYEPDRILYELDNRILESFAKGVNGDDVINDGMDVSVLGFIGSSITFSAAKNDLCVIQNNELQVIPGSKFPIGSNQYKQKKIFEKHDLTLTNGTKLYLYTDGYQDQFGGNQNRKFLSKRFKDFLFQTRSLSMIHQRNRLIDELNAWKGSTKQTDDILIVGIEI